MFCVCVCVWEREINGFERLFIAVSLWQGGVCVCYPLFQRQARRSWPAFYRHVKRRYKGLLWTVEEMTTSDCENVVTVEDSAGRFDWCDQKLQILNGTKMCISDYSTDYAKQNLSWGANSRLSSLMKCATYVHYRIYKTPLRSLSSQVTKPRPLYFINIHFSGLSSTPTSCT